ncbi:MAG: alanine racemase [Verrucomicrobiia bacterium Tous-C2TDCM]|nr:MAG: alanine racemase [Verrucomicrobiae bacterium Tous-C2TDCM]
MMASPGSVSPPPRCWAEIDLGALRHNASRCRSLAGPGCEVMAIVKADAYGHGLPEVVGALSGIATWFGVANLREARRTRAASGGSERGILVLGPATPEEVEPLVAEGFSGAVSLTEEVAAYESAAARLGKTARLHAVIDTGMGRMGCLPDDAGALVSAIRSSPHCQLEGLASHFPSADEDRAFTLDQIASFETLAGALALGAECQIHLGNSAGLLGFQGEMTGMTLVRPGLALYGISPFPGEGSGLHPVMSLKTRVTLVREVPAGTGISYGRTFITGRNTRVATLAVGYGDGYPRQLSGAGAEVLIQGRRCPLLGRVTMDQILVDVTELPFVVRGEEAVLMGKQGEGEITAIEIAQRADTIPWEILTGITSRVERTYH